jgi:hypothetical protein
MRAISKEALPGDGNLPGVFYPFPRRPKPLRVYRFDPGLSLLGRAKDLLLDDVGSSTQHFSNKCRNALGLLPVHRLQL